MIRYIIKRIVVLIPVVLVTSFLILLGHESDRRRSGINFGTR